MEPIPASHSHVISAAQGWLELGATDEALRELASLPKKWARHPVVLELQWTIHAKQKRWQECVTLAQELIDALPEHESGWIHRSYALHELRRTQEALDQLQPVGRRFTKSTTIPYNLACYHAQLGTLEAAREWLNIAFSRTEDAKALKLQALNDPDLKPLHAEIREGGR